MALRSRPVGSDNKQNQSDASSNLTETFSDNRSDIDSTSNPELDSEDSDDENKSSDNISDNEGQLPPEHYLAQAESLTVSQLRQKRYSDVTQNNLDETHMYWDK